MSYNPLVSIVMNCYNGDVYLKEALNSVINQSYSNWELIFWDNKSTDRSIEIFKSYKDKRFKLFHSQEHSILYKARNEAIQKTSGELIAFLDTDDIWFSDKLEKQISFFKEENVGLVYGNFFTFNESSLLKKKIFSKKKLPTGNVLTKILSEYSIGLSTIVIRKKSLKNFSNVFNTKYDLLADYDFAINFSIENEFQCIQDPVAQIRIQEKSTSHKFKEEQIKQLKLWYSSIELHPIISKKKEMKKALERINYMEIMQILSTKKFPDGFNRVLKFPFGMKKIKLILALILPKKIFLQLKKLN